MPTESIRYAVVGAGHISQVAVLPAFEHADEAELVAIVSGDDTKREDLAERYGLDPDMVVPYSDYEQLLASGDIDAVYLATPNHLHHEQTLQAAGAGIHVLCEKPLATNAQECREMNDACRRAGVKLMTAYRLHFEPSTLAAVGQIEAGAIGNPRLFTSVFSVHVSDEDNIRLSPVRKGGGPLHDLGVYCINAARMMLRNEPLWACATTRTDYQDPRFEHCPEMVSVTLGFPDDCLASFVVSFGMASVETFMVVGDEGRLVMEPAYGYQAAIGFDLEDGVEDRVEYGRVDQFAAELLHLSRCILEEGEPAPSGREGLADLVTIDAILASIEANGARVDIPGHRHGRRPEPDQAIHRPPIEEPPPEVHAEGPRS